MAKRGGYRLAILLAALAVLVLALGLLPIWHMRSRSAGPPGPASPAGGPSAAPAVTASPPPVLADQVPPSAAAPTPSVQARPGGKRYAPRYPPIATTPTPMATPPPVSVAEPSPSADPRLSTARPVPRLVVRPGARLVAAIRDQDYYVHPEPVPDLRLARLRRAASGRSFGFEVRVFEQHAEGAMAGGFHVERAGEIVAAALALQLEAMGFQVGLDLTRALAPLRDEMGSRFVIDLDRLAVRATFSGSVRFVVAHAQTSGGYSTGADLRVAVDVSDRAGSVIYSREIAESASAEAKGLEGAAERGRATAAAALSAFVRAFFGDPRLEQSLVELVRRGRQESR